MCDFDLRGELFRGSSGDDAAGVCVKNAAKKNENRYACVHNINMTVDFFTAAVGRVHIVVITTVARQRPNSSTTAVG